MAKHKLLYVNEERIPANLRALVLSYLPTSEFEIETMTYELSDEEKIKKLQWAELVLFAPGRFLSDEVMSHAKHIKLMQLWSSGYDKFNVKAAAEYGIPVANNGGANACSVAEHAILLMLATYRRLPSSHERTVTGNWAGNSHGMDMFLMYGKTLGIIGFGNIGRQVAYKARGFEMKTVYYDINRADPETEKRCEATYMPLDELLSTADIITLHLHYNKNTENILGEREFALMKQNAILINVSRAQLVNQDALYDALSNGKIHGAGFDVYMKEPTVAGDRILTLPNVVATPHIAGSTYDTYVQVMERVVQNLRRAAAGEKPHFLVTGV